MRGFVLLSLLISSAAFAATDLLPTLETAGAVRALRPEEAARHYPVKLRGVVTYYSALDAHAFLQDETGGIFFRPGAPGQAGRSEFTPGERVEISGVTVRGNFSPSVAGGPEVVGAAPLPVTVSRLGAGSLPEPPLVTIEQMLTGKLHDQFVRVRGTLRQVSLHTYRGGERIGLVLSAPGGAEGATMKTYVAGSTADPAGWENTIADVRGVVAGGGDGQARLRDVRLLVPSAAHVVPDLAVMERAFSQEPRPIAALFRYQPPDAPGASSRVRVRGFVTLARPGEGFYLGDGESGLWMQSPQQADLVPGDELDVIGVPGRDERRAFLQDAIFRVSGHRSLPPAREVSAEEAAAGTLISARITVEGDLVDKLQQPGFRQLTLEGAGRIFHARISGDTPAGTDWKTGSRLRVTGICEPAAASGPPAAFALTAAAFGDVAIVSEPPWLDARRLRWIVFALALASALFVLWVALLRRQVARQTGIIAEQSAHRALTEERHRIARELHDTLEQQLAGVHLHLDAVHDWLPDAPARAQSALATARAMLAHSRAEARQSVFELRAPALEQLGLVGATRHHASRVAEAARSRVAVSLRGDERRLPGPVEFHLLRIVQEAITNALKHAGAGEIAVEFEFDAQAVRIRVRDDGRGFDPAARPPAGKMQFGLLGMRERVAKIHGRLDVQSAPAAGTTLTVEVPIRA